MSGAGPTAQTWFVKTNRHRATDGEEWGWVSAEFDGSATLDGASVMWRGEDGRATASLIAAAPELRAVAKRAEACLAVAVRAAIAGFSDAETDAMVDNHIVIKALRAAIAKAEAQ